MLGKVWADWCWVCHAKPGRDGNHDDDQALERRDPRAPERTADHDLHPPDRRAEGAEQLRFATGERMCFTQEDVSLTGHAVESRVCA